MHYIEGIKNWASIWSHHGIRILAGPSSIWLDATGKRFSAPNFPGFDTLSTLEAIMKTGYDYSRNFCWRLPIYWSCCRSSYWGDLTCLVSFSK